MKISFAIIVI